MRISGGEARGRIIALPRGCRIRPTTERVKESLFDLLGPVRDACFLDLFAGCGNVGLEAISRGVSKAVFVEKSPRLAAAIAKNLALLGFEERGEILALEADGAIRLLGRRAQRYDVLFADPPYEEGYVSALMQWLARTDLLASSGVAILQHSFREAIDVLTTSGLQLTDQRRYGDTRLSFLRKKRENGDV